jgi:hypothetical protein
MVLLPFLMVRGIFIGAIKNGMMLPKENYCECSFLILPFEGVKKYFTILLLSLIIRELFESKDCPYERVP